MVNDMQSNINRLTGQSNNPDFGPTTITQQPPSNIGGPSNVLGGVRMPMVSGGPSMVSANQAGGPSQVPNFDETNLSQGMNQQFRLNPNLESNPNSPSLMTNPPPGQGQQRPHSQMNNAQGPMNNLQSKYPEQNMQQKLMMSLPPSHIYYPQNHARPLMGQQTSIPYQPPNYFNGNAENMNEVPMSTNPPAGYPGQSLPNMNFGRYQQ